MVTLALVVAGAAAAFGLSYLDAYRIRRGIWREPLFPLFEEWREEHDGCVCAEINTRNCPVHAPLFEQAKLEATADAVAREGEEDAA